MGLAAKRFEQDYSENRIPGALKSLEAETQGATKNLAVEFDWKSFGDNQQAMDGAWQCWEQALQGISAVCSDQIGRDAVKKGVKKVRIMNLTASGPAEVTYKNGVLTMAVYFADGTQSSPGYDAVKKTLEEGLD